MKITLEKMTPKNFKENTPEYAISGFFEKWHKDKYANIEKYVQKSWLAIHNCDFIESRFKNIKFVALHEFGKHVHHSEVFEEYKIIGTLRYHKDVNRKEFIDKEVIMYVNVLKEIDKYKTSPNGEWGVNPTSMFRIDSI
jgi:hypothetical protein